MGTQDKKVLAVPVVPVVQMTEEVERVMMLVVVPAEQKSYIVADNQKL